MQSHLYIMRMGVRVKVGKAQKPDKRRKVLENEMGQPVELVYVAVVDDAVAQNAEYMAHRYLGASRLGGEWFSCSVEEAKAAINEAISNHKSVDRHGEVALLEDYIREDGLLALIIAYDGEISTRQARRELQRPLGFAIKRLNMRGLTEPWTDVLRLRPEARTLATEILRAAPATNGPGPTGESGP